MKSTCYRLNGQFGFKNLTRYEEPISDLPPPGYVLVKTKSVALNYRDLLILEGQYDPRIPLDCIPCSDMAGEIVSVGQNINELKAGDQVVSTFYQWPEGSGLEQKIRFYHTLGGPLDGVLSEYRLYPHWGVSKYPAHLTSEEAATIPCAGVSAWHAVFDPDHPTQPGDTIVIIGSGGVGIYALKLALLAGAQVVMITRTHDKVAKLKALGAHHVIVQAEHPEWSDALREINPQGADRVIELGGTGTLTQSIRSTRLKGAIYLLGVVADPADITDKTMKRLLMYGITLKGILVGGRSLQLKLMRCMDKNQLRPLIDKTFAWDDAISAFEYLRSAKHLGKIIINL
jgi:NADPH:quinone reductase-like Zn-dependent oxidoreductase